MNAAAPDRAWFLTLTNRQFFYDEPEAYAFDPEEIAHALSNLCRFNGHLKEHYDVAHHSVLVAYTVRFLLRPDGNKLPLDAAERRLLRAALLHDGSESMLSDVPRPLKRHASMAPYRAMEERVQRAILRCFGLEDLHEHPLVKRADAMMLESEKRSLRLPSTLRQEFDDGECAPFFVVPMPPEESRDLFMAIWRNYGD